MPHPSEERITYAGIQPISIGIYQPVSPLIARLMDIYQAVSDLD
jgi:hypothetical protein